jgi:TRAP-type mannitol/chloroaromatic compound transport system substrate-binding protein
MKRFAKTALCATALMFTAGGFAGTAQAEDNPSVFWKFSVWGKPRSFTKGPELMAERLAEATDGKFQMKIFYGGQLSKAKENLDGLKVNAFEATIACNFYHPGKTPALMVLSLPFLPMSDFDSAAKVRNALYADPVLQDEFAQWNGMLFGSTHLPQYEFMGTGDAPATLADWKGLRVRAGGGVGEAMEQLGAVRQNMPASEVYTALQRGTADAVSFPYTYAHAAFKLHEVANWFTANLSPGTADCPIVINKTAYDKLPAHYQELLMSLQGDVEAVYKEAYAAADEKNLPMFHEKLNAVEYGAETLAEFRANAGQPIWDKWVADNAESFDSQAILDLVLNAGGGS